MCLWTKCYVARETCSKPLFDARLYIYIHPLSNVCVHLRLLIDLYIYRQFVLLTLKCLFALYVVSLVWFMYTHIYTWICFQLNVISVYVNLEKLEFWFNPFAVDVKNRDICTLNVLEKCSELWLSAYKCKCKGGDF